MKPYYSHNGIEIFLGDCREVLPFFESQSFDLLLTDPPYPNMKGGVTHVYGGVAGNKRRVESQTVGDPWQASLDWTDEAWRVTRMGAFVFCSYHCVDDIAARFPRESRAALLTWYKRNSAPSANNAPRYTTEFIWAFRKGSGLNWRKLDNTLIDIPMLSAGCVSTGERFTAKDGSALHPAQKPESVIGRLLSVGGNSLVDCFAGTGTSLVIAKRYGLKAVGIETEERYCEVTAKRLEQTALALSAPVSPSMEQVGLLESTK